MTYVVGGPRLAAALARAARNVETDTWPGWETPVEEAYAERLHPRDREGRWRDTSSSRAALEHWRDLKAGQRSAAAPGPKPVVSGAIDAPRGDATDDIRTWGDLRDYLRDFALPDSISSLKVGDTFWDYDSVMRVAGIDERGMVRAVPASGPDAEGEVTTFPPSTRVRVGSRPALEPLHVVPEGRVGTDGLVAERPDARNARQIARALTDMLGRYPQVTTSTVHPLREVAQTADLDLPLTDALTGGLTTPGVWGSVSVAGLAPSPTTLSFNNYSASSLDDYERADLGIQSFNDDWDTVVAKGNVGAADVTPYGRTVHEFGHVISRALGLTPSQAADELQDNGLLPDQIGRFSRYGAANAQEGLAEVFAAGMVPGAIDAVPEELRAGVRGVIADVDRRMLDVGRGAGPADPPAGIAMAGPVFEEAMRQADKNIAARAWPEHVQEAYAERLHPRDRLGRWMDVLSRLKVGKPETVRGVKVEATRKGFVVNGQAATFVGQAAKVAVSAETAATGEHEFDPIFEGFEHAGLTTTVRSTDVAGGWYHVVGNVIDEGGDVVGEFDRSVRDYGHYMEVSHNSFNLRPGQQHKGFGAAFTAHELAGYAALGKPVDVKLDAGSSVGGYAWAKLGFDWDHDGHAQLARMRREVDGVYGGSFEGAVRSGAPDRSFDFDAFNAFLDREPPPSPVEVAAYGRDNSWVEGVRAPGVAEPGDEKMWLGKKFLLGSDWQGVKHVLPVEHLASEELRERLARKLLEPTPTPPAPEGVTYNAGVAKINGPQDAERYLRDSFGIDAHLVSNLTTETLDDDAGPARTDSAARWKRDRVNGEADFWRQIAQAVSDAEERFPVLSQGERPLRQIVVKSTPGYERSIESTGGIWGSTGPPPTPGAPEPPFPNPAAATTGIVLNDGSASFVGANPVAGDGTAPADLSAYGEMMHELGHAVAYSSGSMFARPSHDMGGAGVEGGWLHDAGFTRMSDIAHISEYGAANQFELWAEIFTTVNTPGFFDRLRREDPAAAEKVERLRGIANRWSTWKVL